MSAVNEPASEPSAVSLPNHATLRGMRREARLLQAAARAGAPPARDLVARHTGERAGVDFQLQKAQLVVARAHGFASWARLKRYFEVADGLRFEPIRERGNEPPEATFCRLACLTYSDQDGPQRWDAARVILAAHPTLPRAHLAVAAAAGDVDALIQHLDHDRGAAQRRSGVHAWSPLYYLTYSRVADPDAALGAAGTLLAAGADPNEGYLWAGQPTPFTLLTGALGSGEQGASKQPPLPQQFARMLLDAGADPNDAQALYNRQFEHDDSHLRLLFEYGLGAGGGGPWRRLLGDVLDDPAQLLRGQLSWAVDHGMVDRVRLLAANGTDLAGRDRYSHTAVEAALLSGRPDIGEVLLAAGAAPPTLDGPDQLIAAALAANRDQTAQLGEHVPAARSRRPGLIVWATALDNAAAVQCLLDLGWDVDAFGRADAPIEQHWETSLHAAAGNGNQRLVALLLARGARRDLRDRRFGGTPADWAGHFGHSAVMALLE